MSYISNQVGFRIRKLREVHNISRESLASTLELSDSYIGLIERGTRGVTIHNLVKIANYFNVSMDYFFMDENASSKFTSTRLQHISHIIDGLSQEDYEFIVRMTTNFLIHFNQRNIEEKK